MSLQAVIDREAVLGACRRFGVRRLRVFGSAVSEDFDPERSDVDFLVDFESGRPNRFADYFGLKHALERSVGRPVDLVTAESIRNPYFRASVLASAEDLYAAQERRAPVGRAGGGTICACFHGGPR